MSGEDRQRGAKLMRRVGGEVALGAKAFVEPVEGGIDRMHQRRQLARQVVQGQSALALGRCDPGRHACEALEWPQPVAQGQRADDERGEEGRQQRREQLLVQLPAQHGHPSLPVIDADTNLHLADRAVEPAEGDGLTAFAEEARGPARGASPGGRAEAKRPRPSAAATA